MLLLLSLLVALQEPTPDPIQDYWAALLRSAKPQERELAARRLKSMGKPALGAVEPLLKDPDPEVWDLARQIVDDMRKDGLDPARKKLEETLLQAKTVKLCFEVREGVDEGLALKGEILVKTGGKLRCWMLDPKGVSTVSVRLISDGQNLFLEDDRSSRTIQAPTGLGAEILVDLVRAGLFPTLTDLSQGKLDPSKNVRIMRESHLEAAHGDTFLEFDLLPGQQKTGFHHRVQCQPEKGIVVSRRMVRDGRVLREDYLQMALNEDIPDGMFVLPDK